MKKGKRFFVFIRFLFKVWIGVVIVKGGWGLVGF